MADAWMWSFEVDSEWLLVHGTPGAGLVPFRRRGGEPAALEEVLFLADCISFDHDMPTVVRPSTNAPAAEVPLVQPVVPYPGDRPGLWYYDALEQALLLATDVRVGEAVALRYDENHLRLTQFAERFADSGVPLALYAMATRQVDILAEYLCLYRVLEWPNQDDGRSLIADRLPDLKHRDFGKLGAVAGVNEWIDVFECYRDRALKRIDELVAEGMDHIGIADHLYRIRNGLAHGKSGVVVSDFGASITTVGAELPIVKLLARLGVEPLSEKTASR